MEPHPFRDDLRAAIERAERLERENAELRAALARKPRAAMPGAWLLGAIVAAGAAIVGYVVLDAQGASYAPVVAEPVAPYVAPTLVTPTDPRLDPRVVSGVATSESPPEVPTVDPARIPVPRAPRAARR